MTDGEMKVSDLLRTMRAELRNMYGAREGEAVLRLVFLHVKGWNPVDLIIHEGDTLSPFAVSQIDAILAKLKAHIPIQYITGEARFHGLDFSVNPNVLIPRPETSELVDLIEDDFRNRRDLCVLDIGTGSGCIAISLARALPFSRVEAIDISPSALNVARENAGRLKANVVFRQKDIFSPDPVHGDFDIIVSNPPYIDLSERDSMEPEVKDHEPGQALFVPDSDPLVFYRRITEIARRHLRPDGRLYFEINPRHSEDMIALAENTGFKDVQLSKDSYGKNRFLSATQP